MVMELPDTSELVVLGSNDEPMEEDQEEEPGEDPTENLKEDPEEDPELGKPQTDHFN